MKKSVYSISAGIFLISFAVYLLTMCPTVHMGDCGELISAAFLMGVAHPPGYPLYCILGKLFTFLPLGEIAFRVNVLTGFCSSLAVMIVYLIIIKLVMPASGIKPEHHIASASMALAFSFSNDLWSYSILSKFYTLHAFLTAILLYILLAWSLSGRITMAIAQRRAGNKNVSADLSPLLLFSFIYGVAMSNHHMMGLLGPVFVVFGLVFVYQIYGITLWKKLPIIKIAVLFAIGLSVYFYLVLRASAVPKPEMNWGDPHDLYRTWEHIARKQYGEVGRNPWSVEMFFRQCWTLIALAWQQFYVFGFLAVFGIKRLWCKDKRWLFLLFFLFLAGGFGLSTLLNFTINPEMIAISRVYYVPMYMVIGIWMALGIIELIEKINRNVLRTGLAVAAFIIPVFLLSKNYAANDRHDDYVDMSLAYNFLKTTPSGSVLFSSSDNPTFALAYIQMVEKRKRDIKIYDDYGSVFQNIYGSRFLYLPKLESKKMIYEIQKKIMDESVAPVFFCLRSNANQMSGITAQPVGLLYKVVKDTSRPAQPEPDLWQQYDLRNLDNPELCKDYWHREAFGLYHLAKAEEYAGINGTAATPGIERALAEYKKAGEIAYDVLWVHRNLGAMLTRRLFLDEAIKAYDKVIAYDPYLPDAYSNVGVIYFRIAQNFVAQKNPDEAGKNLEKASEYYKKAIGLDPTFADVHNNLGVVYQVQSETFNIPGKKEEAITEWRKALALNPYLVEVRANLIKAGINP